MSHATSCSCSHAATDAVPSLSPPALDPTGAVVATPPVSAWRDLPPAALADRIEAHFHPALRDLLASVVDLSRRVDAAHVGHPERAVSLTGVLEGMRDELLPHMEKEERVLFPMIRAGALTHVHMPIAAMRSEHVSTLDALARVRTLTSSFRPPADACPTWHTLYRELARLDRDLRLHVGAEDELLFPLALRAARAGRS